MIRREVFIGGLAKPKTLSVMLSMRVFRLRRLTLAQAICDKSALKLSWKKGINCNRLLF
ncbi:hypothetical protein Metme_2721 [Methylomonas methanica MC09]|uniref:Uncharacterized protein n=2 Tax=Methylomonas methanica TaxID=421 RepID=F9ZZ80_METMM|nr:hypothetical protein Metme_2721 [Methylomonas methanica MC09]